MTARVAALLAFAAGLAACGGAPPQAAPTPPANEAPPAAATPPATTATAPAPAASDEGLTTRKLANGMTGAVRSTPGRRTALLQVGVDAGAAMLAPGAAELALHALAEADVGDGLSADELARIRRDLGDPDIGSGRVSLRRRIADLGGTMALHTGPLSCWLDIRVDAPSWPAAAAAVARALAEPTPARAEFERIRQELVAARTRELANEPGAAMARVLLLGEEGSDSYLRGLVDRDVSEAAMFLARGWQPERMRVVVEAPQATADLFRLLDGDEGAVLGRWTRRTAGPGMPFIARRFDSGLWWSPAPDASGSQLPCRLAAVLALPAPEDPAAADDLVMLSCLTLQGLGGRLERTLAARGLGEVAWRARTIATPDATALLLECEAANADVGPIWRAFEAARASLRESPPDAAELALARGHAPLLARLGSLDDGARARRDAAMATAGAGFDALDARIRAAVGGTDAAVRAAADRFLQRPFALVVAGGTVAADIPGVRTFGAAPTTAVAAPSEAAPAAAPDASAPGKGPQPWLQRATDAVGGEAALRRLRGWRGECVRTTEGAPPIREQAEWNDDGALARKRTALGQTVTTTLAGDGGTEALGATSRPVDAATAASLRREMRRHPLALLAAHARGELPFRAVSVREDADRRLAVLETTSGGFDRLRVHIDVQSCLVRLVESWETTPDGAVVHWREAWQDYRAVGALRAPFFALVTQDDGRASVAASWSAWTPTLQPE
jgi:hypothetical protein